MQSTSPRRTRALRFRAWSLGILVATQVLAGLGRPPPRVARVWTVDVQHAPPWQLELLPGVGRARARALVHLRQLAPLRGPADLQEISGLGPKQTAHIAQTKELRTTWADAATPVEAIRSFDAGPNR